LVKFIVLASMIAVLDLAGRSTGEGCGDVFRSARRGDRKAWGELLERYLPLIGAIARGYRLNNADVEDVSQTVCLRLVEHIHRIRRPSALPAWIATAARRESLRLARHRGRVVPFEHLDDVSGGAASDGQQEIDANLLNLELGHVLDKSLNQLPANQRELLMLLSGEQSYSYREIGEILEIPLGSIGPTRSRGLARIRATSELHDYLADADDAQRLRSA
jgi:RNA polymerase sigma factor (sigma-70 family)